MGSTSNCTIMPYSDVVGKLRHYITWRPFKCDFTENLTPMKRFLAQKSANKIRILPLKII